MHIELDQKICVEIICKVLLKRLDVADRYKLKDHILMVYKIYDAYDKEPSRKSLFGLTNIFNIQTELLYKLYDKEIIDNLIKLVNNNLSFENHKYVKYVYEEMLIKLVNDILLDELEYKHTSDNHMSISFGNKLLHIKLDVLVHLYGLKPRYECDATYNGFKSFITKCFNDEYINKDDFGNKYDYIDMMLTGYTNKDEFLNVEKYRHRNTRPSSYLKHLTRIIIDHSKKHIPNMLCSYLDIGTDVKPVAPSLDDE